MTTYLRWVLTAGLLAWAAQGTSWGMTIALFLLFVRAEVAVAFYVKLQGELDEWRELMADYVEADTRFTDSVVKVFEHQMRTLDKQEMLSSLHFTARKVTETQH